MFKLKIISPNKTKEKWLEEALDEYVKRLQPYLEIEWLWVKNDKQLLEHSTKEKNLICLDPLGKLFDSSKFSQFLISKFIEHHSRLTFIIGGPEGLPKELKQNTLVSLSPLTMTHQIIRLVLVEQIYRSIEIYRGSQYHK